MQQLLGYAPHTRCELANLFCFSIGTHVQMGGAKQQNALLSYIQIVTKVHENYLENTHSNSHEEI